MVLLIVLMPPLSPSAVVHAFDVHHVTIGQKGKSFLIGYIFGFGLVLICFQCHYGCIGMKSIFLKIGRCLYPWSYKICSDQLKTDKL